MALKDFKGALIDLNQSVSLKQSNASTFHNRGVAKYYLKDYEGAIIDFTASIEMGEF